MRRYAPWLRAAGVYNVVWGAVVVAAVPAVPWKIVGMMVGCYGVGYWLAARRPNPELVAVGLLGKVLGPIGFAWGAATGRLPLSFGLLVLANDVVWWPAFAGYLRSARSYGTTTSARVAPLTIPP